MANERWKCLCTFSKCNSLVHILLHRILFAFFLYMSKHHHRKISILKQSPGDSFSWDIFLLLVSLFSQTTFYNLLYCPDVQKSLHILNPKIYLVIIMDLGPKDRLLIFQLSDTKKNTWLCETGTSFQCVRLTRKKRICDHWKMGYLILCWSFCYFLYKVHMWKK